MNILIKKKKNSLSKIENCLFILRSLFYWCFLVGFLLFLLSLSCFRSHSHFHSLALNLTFTLSLSLSLSLSRSHSHFHSLSLSRSHFHSSFHSLSLILSLVLALTFPLSSLSPSHLIINGSDPYHYELSYFRTYFMLYQSLHLLTQILPVGTCKTPVEQ